MLAFLCGLWDSNSEPHSYYCKHRSDWAASQSCSQTWDLHQRPPKQWVQMMPLGIDWELSKTAIPPMNKKAFLSMERHFLIGSLITNSERLNFKDQWHTIQNSIWITCLEKIWTWGHLQASEASLTSAYLPVWLMFTRCLAFHIFQGIIYKQWHAWSLIRKHSKCRMAPPALSHSLSGSHYSGFIG